MGEKGVLKSRTGETISETDYSIAGGGGSRDRETQKDSSAEPLGEWQPRGVQAEIRLWPARELSPAEQQGLVLETREGRCYDLDIDDESSAAPVLALGTEKECEW